MTEKSEQLQKIQYVTPLSSIKIRSVDAFKQSLTTHQYYAYCVLFF